MAMIKTLWDLRHSRTLRTIAVFASGNMLAMLLGVFGSLVQARFIGPEQMGVLRTFTIAAGYLTFLHLGVFDGLQREIPMKLGQGDRQGANSSAAACLSWILLVSGACGLVFLGLAARAALHGDWMRFWGWLTYTPIIISSFYGGYLGTTFRTGQQFVTLSKASVLQALAGTVTLVLMPILGYYGACLRAAMSSVTNLLFLHRWRPMKVRPSLDWRSFLDVIRIGLPLSGAGYIYTSLWVSMEGTLVLHWFGVKVLGLYSISVFVRTLVAELAQNMNHVINVKIYEQYGRTGRAVDCVRLIFKPTAMAVAASLPLIAAGWFALPYVIAVLMPKYVGAISFMRLMLFAMPITFLNLPNTVLWATGRWADCFLSVIAGFVAFVGLSFVFHPLIAGAHNVLIASISGQVINIFVSYTLIFRLAVKDRLKEPMPG